MQLLFYSPHSSPRLEYIVSTLFDAIGLTGFEITSDIDHFKAFDGAKINYSQRPVISDELLLKPVDLLFKQNIEPQQLYCKEWKNLKIFFETEGFLPFDIFAASFYLITRYEEYLPHELDEYGRYGHKNSLAFKENFLHLPLVNLWLNELREQLVSRFSGLLFKQRGFKFIPTYDVDIAWNYLRKGLLRNIGGTARSFVKGEWSSIVERIQVLIGRKKDPFDIYDELDQLHHKYDLSAYYFFLLANSIKGYDRNIHPACPEFRTLIQEHCKKYNIGIHPSWQSGDILTLLKEEIKTLGQITSGPIKNSRQHYIRIKLPDTYRKLIGNGIESDFSMGYGSINGFRASYCLPYYWFDLEKNEKTNLLIHPFCYMEANSYYEQQYTLHQATEEIYYYYRVTKEVDGLLITIFHNHLLGNKRLFEGWKEMYEQFCKNVSIPG